MNDKVDKRHAGDLDQQHAGLRGWKGKGGLRIENAANNGYNMRVRIVIDNGQADLLQRQDPTRTDDPGGLPGRGAG